MIPLLARTLVLAGVLILIGALLPVRRLIGRLPCGSVRNSWHIMAALIVLFIAGYLGYVTAFWESHTNVISLIVPGVFFFGACFVWLTSSLSLQTAIDVKRVSLLERESSTDPLTGVFNRRCLDQRLIDEIARAQRYCLPLSILLLDIDHFKQINDRHGHQSGDRVLISFSTAIAEELRDSDVLARYGGDEFMVILPNTTSPGANGIAERVRKRIESHRFSVLDDPAGICVTTSIGLASLGDDVESKEKLIRAADESLYLAKQGGRNRVAAGLPGTARPPEPA